MDRDAALTYQDAIGKVTDERTRQNLQRFQQDHRNHARDIDELLKAKGWQAVEPTQEFQELMEGFKRFVDTAEGGEDAVMVAMELAETATNAEYSDALQLDVDAQCKQVLQKNFHDEQHHLQFIESRVPVGAMRVSARKPGGGYGTGGYGTGDQYGGGESGTNPSGAEGGLGGAGTPGGLQERIGSAVGGGQAGDTDEAAGSPPRLRGQIEGESGSSGSGVAGSGPGF